jgi:hypothetical protein
VAQAAAFLGGPVFTGVGAFLCWAGFADTAPFGGGPAFVGAAFVGALEVFDSQAAALTVPYCLIFPNTTVFTLLAPDIISPLTSLDYTGFRSSSHSDLLLNPPLSFLTPADALIASIVDPITKRTDNFTAFLLFIITSLIILTIINTPFPIPPLIGPT